MGGVDGHPVEPGRQSGLAPEVSQLCRQGKADVLSQVFRGFLASREAEAKAKKAVVVAIQERGKCRAISAGGGQGQLSVIVGHVHRMKYDARTAPVLGAALQIFR